MADEGREQRDFPRAHLKSPSSARRARSPLGERKRFGPLYRRVSEKVFGAESELQASPDDLRALIDAKDLSKLMRLHSGNICARRRSRSVQTSEVGRTAGPFSNERAEPKHQAS